MTTFIKTKPGAVLEYSTTHFPRYKVLLHNDDVNSMEHVMQALIRVFRFDEHVSAQITIDAHNTGVALCIVEPYEQAEFHRDQLRAYSLFATIEPE